MTKYNSETDPKHYTLEETLTAVEEILYAQNSSLYSLGGQGDEDEITISVDLIQSLQNIEPQSGEAVDAPMAETRTTVTPSIGGFTTAIFQSGYDDLGPLEETIVDYLTRLPSHANAQSPLSSILVANQTQYAQNATNEVKADNASLIALPADTDDDQPLEPVTEDSFDLGIRLSNATFHVGTTNNSESHNISSDLSTERHKLTAEAINLSTVSDDAVFIYNVNSKGHVNALLKSEWNSIKNIEIDADHHASVTVKNFVHTSVKLSGSEDSTVVIRDAKRGDVETGDGDDKISVFAKSNGSGWSNNFTIETNDGEDTLYLKGDQGYTIFSVDSGDDADSVRILGQYETSTVHLGNGDDRFVGRAGQDNVFGGEGNDLIKGGHGDDIINGGAGDDRLYGGKGADRFTWEQNDLDGQSIDRVFDFNAKQGDMIDISDLLQFDTESDALIADFVRLVDADKGKSATLEIREQGAGDWVSLVEITRGAQLDSIETLVDDGTFII